MQGLMQNWPLTVDRILDHTKRWHGAREVISRSVEGPIVRSTYGEIYDRAKQLSNALLDIGVQPGDRIATLAWNTARHLECWYGIMGIGAVCHTLNPRLFPEQLVYIINHAEDRIIFTDLSFLATLQSILPQCPTVERVVVLTDAASMPAFTVQGEACPKFKGAADYEGMIAGYSADAKWGGFDENTACGLCYTSGTTGNPKGVLYSHRSNFIHSLVGLSSEVLGITVRDVVLPVVPLFHANAWGLAFDCPAVGAKLVMPGPKLDGASIYELMETEGVTFSAGVPTVWQMLLQHMDTTKSKFSTLKRLVVGGSAVPEALLRGFHDRYDIDLTSAWGMTETSPLGTIARLTPELDALPYDEQVPYRLKGGRPPLGIELKITNDAGDTLPNDGHTFGRLKVSGPFVAGEYFKGDGGDILDSDGYFDTGDVATIDQNGFMSITDRAKDVIKSGGEWISSIDIENIACGHPKALIAAVIGVAHPKWDERPLLLVKLKEGEVATIEEFLVHLEGKIAKWWMPDDVVFVDDIPLGATGKIDKKVIRKQFEGYVLPSVAAASGAARALAAPSEPVIYAPDPLPGAPQSGGGASEAPGEPEAAAHPQAPSLTEGEIEQPVTDVVRTSPAGPADTPAARLLTLLLLIALAPAALVVGAALLVRLGELDWRSGYQAVLTGGDGRLSLALIATWFGVAAGALGLIVARGSATLQRRAVVNIFITAATLAGLLYLHQLSRSTPPIHDVASDWRAPLGFSSVSLARRGSGAEPVEMDPVQPADGTAFGGRRIARLNAEFCPTAAPLVVAKPAAAVYAQAKAALRDAGLALVAENPDEGRLEATASGLIYGFKDDVVLRIRPEGQGARVDIRSVGRLPRPDLGANCRRVTSLLEALRG